MKSNEGHVPHVRYHRVISINEVSIWIDEVTFNALSIILYNSRVAIGELWFKKWSKEFIILKTYEIQ